MTFKEQLDSLKAKLKEKIKPESKPEEIEEINGLISSLDSMETIHDQVVAENGKFKDTIVRMVTNEGNSDTPADDVDGSKPKSMDEVIAELEKEGGK